MNLEKKCNRQPDLFVMKTILKKNLAKHHTYEEWIMADHHSDTTVYDAHQLQKQNKTKKS